MVDENNSAVQGAKVRLLSGDRVIFEGVTGPTGQFHARLPAAGRYHAEVSAEGFFPLKNMAVDLVDSGTELHLVLNHEREVFQSVRVSASPASVDVERTSQQQNLSGLEMLDVPYPSTHSLRNAMALMPGVVQDVHGGVHFDGSAENQVLYTLDGFNVGDPLTGTLEARVPVDSVRSLEYSTGRYSPEFGKGSAGALAIQTTMGTDQFRPWATNFIPGVDTKKGLHMGSWTPRAGISGPLVKGRAWFSESVDAQYSPVVIDDLPKGQDRTTTVSASDLLRAQVNLTPANILFASFLANYTNAPGTGLSALDPMSTTIDARSRAWFYSVKDQAYLAHDMLLEAGFAQNRTFDRQIPQGSGVYVITPDGRQGNYFADLTRYSRRDQFLANLFLPEFRLWGRHRIKIGMDVDRLGYRLAARRTSYELFGLAGTLLRTTRFAGAGRLDLSSLEASSYLLDSWRVRPSLALDLGIRQDWNELEGQTVLSPRISAAWSPAAWKNTKISGGFAVTHDGTPLDLFARPLDQYAVTTSYLPDGTPAAPPAATAFVLDGRHLSAPRYRNWSLGLEQVLPRRITLQVSLMRRRGLDGFAYQNLLRPGEPVPPQYVAAYGTGYFEGIYALANYRRDQYDSAQVSLRQPFGERYEWMVSYTRSRAVTNAAMDINVDNPLLIGDNAGPMSWDCPNRLLSWAYLPTPWKNWAISYLLEARNGFPFSVQRDTGEVVGPVNSYRLPNWFSLNLHVERRLRWHGYRFALRGGFNNITGHNNYTIANNTIGSPFFLKYYGDEGRHFVVRIRYLGKEGGM